MSRLAAPEAYGLRHLLLREEGCALPVCARGLFTVLSAVIFPTRRVRWNDPAG